MRNQTLFFVGAIAAFFVSSPAATAAEKPQPRVVACTWIKTINQLQAMRNNLAATYCLANDIDASAKANFIPIGTPAAPFTGRFHGHGHVVRNLTITSSRELIGLFGLTDQAVIQDVGLVDVSISGPGPSALGGLVGNAEATSGTSTIARVFVTGQISCTHTECKPGGIAGIVGTNTTLTESWSAVDITAVTSSEAGGVVGRLYGTLSRSFARGSVSCDSSCFAGGLVGRSEGGNVLASYATGTIHASDDSDVGGAIGFAENGAVVQRSYATGPVSADPDASAGGLIGLLSNSTVTESYAAGPVSGGTAARVGGLVGLLSTDAGKTSTVTESYAVGAVTAPAGNTTVGGLVGAKAGTGTVADDFAYWDIETTGQSSSAAGIARLTSDMRSTTPCCLPGRSNPWAITSTLSYPFLNDFDIDFASPLATLVHSSKVFIFLPIGQLDVSQYMTAPAHADAADLAAVYTMVARAIGITDNDSRLKDVKIDRFFWDDSTQTATFRGPVTTHATLGTLTTISASTPLNDTNVIGSMNAENLVILRGTYKKSNGTAGSHWMLGTLYTTAADDSVSAVVANDPFTGEQIEIDPATKRVLSPANFPLANFRVNAYQSVTLN